MAGQYVNDNTALGSGALQKAIENLSTIGFNNTACGNNPLRDLDSGVNESTAFGSQTLASSSIGENSAFGAHSGANIGPGTGNALFGNWAGRYISNNYNTAHGYRALAGDNNLNNFPNTGISLGGRNTAVGASTMRYAPTGSDNTAIGCTALQQTNGGSSNTAVGSGACTGCTVGSGNTVVGSEACAGCTVGSNNTAIGAKACISCTTGNNNTLIGAGTDVNSNNAIKRTAIGAGVVATNDNTIIIGSTENVGIGTTSPDSRLHVVNSTTNVAAIHSVSSSGSAVQANGVSGNIGVVATSDSGTAISAQSNGTDATILTVCNGSGNGISAYANTGTAIYGQSDGASVAIIALANGVGNGIDTFASTGNALYASTIGTGAAILCNASGSGDGIVVYTASGTGDGINITTSTGTAIIAQSDNSDPNTTITSIALGSGNAISAKSYQGNAIVAYIPATSTTGSAIAATSDVSVALYTNGGHQYAKIALYAPTVNNTPPIQPYVYNATINDHIIVIIDSTMPPATAQIILPDPDTCQGSIFIIRNAHSDPYTRTITTTSGHNVIVDFSVPYTTPVSTTATIPVQTSQHYVSDGTYYIRFA